MNIQTQVLTLTTPELAILTHYLVDNWPPLDQTALADLNIDEAQLAEVQESLEEAGLLIYTPDDENPGVAGPVARMLETILYPDRLCALRILNRKNEQDKQIFFSFADGLVVRNDMATDGQHAFAELPDLDDVVREMLQTVVEDSNQPDPPQATRPLADLLPQTKLLAILLLIGDPAQSETAVESLSWLQTEDGLWFADATLSTPEQAQSTSFSALQQRLLTTLQRFTGEGQLER